MLDIGWTELLVIGALALIVVGPRDLPQLLRTVGQTVGKIKRMARDFQRSMEDAARETDVANFKEMRDLKKDLGSFDFRTQANKAQSYLNKPVKADGKPAETEAGRAAAANAGTAAAGDAADKAASAAPVSAPVEPAERQPAQAQAGSQPETPEPRQAGTGAGTGG